MGKLLLLLGGSLVLTGAGGAATRAGSTRDIPVKATRANEVRPVASTNAFAWAVRHWSSSHRSSHYDAYVQIGKGTPVKINAPGTSAFPGGISGDTLVFEQWHRGHADIVFYSLSRKARFAPPAGVDSARADEVAPSRAGDWLLFERLDNSSLAFFMRNLVTGEQVQLRRWPPLAPRRARSLTGSTQVNGNFAVFSFGRPYVYDIPQRQLNARANGYLLEQYFSPASISETGTIYAVARSLDGPCQTGHPARSLVRFGVGEDAYTTVTTVPRGFYVGSSYAVDEGGRTTIYYERRNCTTGRSDIYKTIDPN